MTLEFREVLGSAGGDESPPGKVTHTMRCLYCGLEAREGFFFEGHATCARHGRSPAQVRAGEVRGTAEAEGRYMTEGEWAFCAQADEESRRAWDEDAIKAAGVVAALSPEARREGGALCEEAHAAHKASR